MTNIPLWLCIPFAGLLLCIAILPLVKGEWWEKNQPYAVIAWSLLFIIPFAVKFGAANAAETVLECLVNDYLTFIVLLFGLFCVAGNIKLEGNLIGNPIVNVVTLAVGTFFSSWIGTTGASMLFVRPIIQMNSWRKKTYHDLFYFPRIKHWRMSYTDRRSTASYGIFKRSFIFLEHEAYAGTYTQHGNSSYDILFP